MERHNMKLSAWYWNTEDSKSPIILNCRDNGTGYSGASPEGYGNKIKTPYEVDVSKDMSNDWRQVYAICHSNVTTFYIKHPTQKGNLTIHIERT